MRRKRTEFPGKNDADPKQRGCAEGATEGQREEVETLAVLIAAGAMPFPMEPAPSPRDPLMQRVREIRRTRLLEFIAEVIARDLTQPKLQKVK